jgi:hypothetical protein
MDVHCSQSVTDRAVAICKLHEMADYFLLGDGTWPADQEGLPAVLRTVRELGLNEAVAGQPGMTESTALGKELKLDLMMAFIGACEMWAIPDVLWAHGYIEDREWEELWSGPIIEAERKLSRLVLRSYYDFCNRTKRAN